MKDSDIKGYERSYNQVVKETMYNKLYSGQESSDRITSMAMALYASALPKFMVESDFRGIPMGTRIQPRPQIKSMHIGGINPYHSHEVEYKSSKAVGFPKKELQEQLNKTKKMRTRKFYHTFDFQKREITLCLLTEEQEQTFTQRIRGDEPIAHIKIGYSVCVPEDKFDEKLSKKISLGRANSDKARLEEISCATDFAFDSGILLATARLYERKIKNNEIVIKGIRQPEDFKEFERTNVAEMRPVTTEEIESGLSSMISVSEEDRNNGSPKKGDWIARNPNNHNDQWLVAEQYYKDNFKAIK